MEAAARPEVLAFLADAKEHPDDDTPRLILADWLEENGGPADAARAEFIRAQIARSRLPDGDPGHWTLLQRERELEARWVAEWVRPLRAWAQWWRYERGFLFFALRGALYGRKLAALQGTEAWAWVYGLELEVVGAGEAPRVFDCPLLDGIASLGIRSHDPGTTGLQSLAASPHLSRLVRLRLVCPGPVGVAFLAGSDRLPRLRDLILTGSEIGDTGAAALAGSERLARLERLELARAGIHDAGGLAFAEALRLPRLRELDLSDNRLTDASALALADSPHLDGLTRLVLWGNPIGPEGAAVLTRRFGPRVFLGRG